MNLSHVGMTVNSRIPVANQQMGRMFMAGDVEIEPIGRRKKIPLTLRFDVRQVIGHVTIRALQDGCMDTVVYVRRSALPSITGLELSFSGQVLEFEELMIKRFRVLLFGFTKGAR